MSQANPFDQFDGHAAASPGVLVGPPPTPKEPREPKTSYRPLSKEEISQRGLDPKGNYQISSEGSVSSLGNSTGPAPTEFQTKDGLFYNRMLSSEKQYRDTPAGDRDARTTPGQWFHEAAPNIDANFNSSGRVSSDNAARDWIAASLRVESGAAIGPQEYDNQYRIFFPMPGDGKEQIREKAIKRHQAMLGFKVGSGPLAPEIEKQYRAQFGDKMPWDMPIDGDTPPEKKDDNGNPVAAAGATDGGGSGGNDPGKGKITLAPSEEHSKVAQGDTKFQYDNEASQHMWDMWRAGKSADEIDAYASAKGYEMPAVWPVKDMKARDAAGKNPFYVGKSVPTSMREKAAGGALGAYAAGATNALTAGFSDELFGAANAAVGKDYTAARDSFQGAKTAMAENHPVADVVGNLSGGVMLGPIAGRVSPGLANLAASNPLRAAGVYGTAYGAGENNDNRVAGAVLGGVTGLAGGAVGEKLLAPALTKAVNSRPGQAVINRFTGASRGGGVLGNAVEAAPASGILSGGPSPIETGALNTADQVEIANLAKKATGWGPGAKSAKRQLADKFAANPEAKAAAERLGVDLPPDVLSDNPQAQSLTGLSRSQVGSDAETAWHAKVQQVSDHADKTLAELGGSRDLAQISHDTYARLDGAQKALKNKAVAIRNEVDAAIDPAARVEATNLQKTLGETINNYGGIEEAKAAMSGPEKDMLKMLGEGDKPIQPTYARLTRLRQDVGDAWNKGKGPWADVNRHQLGEYYKALQADQLGAVGQLAGEELAAKQGAANGLFKKMYDQREQMQELFGKNLEKSIAPLLTRAVTTGAKGDVTALNTLLDRVPEDARGGALVSAIMAQSTSKSAERTGFSFANFSKLYRGLRDNGPVFAKMTETIGPQGVRVLNDLHTISQRMVVAENRVLKTGKANQALDAAMQTEGLVGNIFNAAVSRGATGTGAVIGGAVGGPAGSAVGATLAKSATGALENSGASRLTKVHALLASPQFKTMINRIAEGEDAKVAAKPLWHSEAFHNFGRALGFVTPESRRALLVRLTVPSEVSNVVPLFEKAASASPSRAAATAPGDQKQD